MTYATETTVFGPAQASAESKNWATLSHLSAFVVFLGIPSLIGPLVAWLVKRDDPYVEHHVKEALNFNISFLVYAVAAGILILVLVGVVLLPIVMVTWFVLAIKASVRGSRGEHYRYPLTIRFVG